MSAPIPPRRYRFGVFEADAVTGELRRQGLRVRLHAQPFQLLVLLLDRPGQLLTRDEIARALWPADTFVDFDHGLNSAINRIREALGDSASNPRFVQTLSRRGYRFIAPVQSLDADGAPASEQPTPLPAENGLPAHLLATPQDLPPTPRPLVQTLFVLFQFMYLAFYIGALANLAEIRDLLSPLPRAEAAFILLIVTAALLIPVRAFLLTATLFHAPRFRAQFLRIWPILLLLDVLWALSPFLLLPHSDFGLALACTTLLVYSPFAQRSLILMGAGAPRPVSFQEDTTR